MSALLTLYRSLTRHRLYAILNIGGLALGIATFLVLYLFVTFERGYDRVLPGSDKVWLIDAKWDMPGLPDTYNVMTADGLLDQLKADFPEIAGARLRAKKDVPVRNGAAVINENIAEVDTDFFRLFPFPAIEGDPAAAMAQPDAAAVTRSAARKYLGEGSSVGKTITVVADGQDQIYRVAAVLEDMPADMTYTSDIFVPLRPPPAKTAKTAGAAVIISRSITTFLRLPDAATARALTPRMPAFLDRHPTLGSSKSMTMRLRPLSAIHLDNERDKAVVATLGLVGVLTLLIASVNYVNLATARAGLRAREVAIRKVLGGTRASLMAQFGVEAMATVAIAALIGLVIAEVALPFVNSIGGTSLAIRYGGARSILFPLLALLFVVGGLAGIYPAFVLSRFRPAAVLASAQTPGGGKAGARLRQALVVIQFAIAIAFTIGTAVLVGQTAHLRSADLGFERDGLIVVPSYWDKVIDDAQRADLLRAFAAIPGVTQVGRSASTPGGGSISIVSTSNDQGGPSISMHRIDTGPGFFDTYRARLLAGRLFSPAYRLDDIAGTTVTERMFNPQRNNIIVNRTAMKALGFASPEDAIGKSAKLGLRVDPTIVGVIEDMRFLSPREPVPPVLYSYDSQALAGTVPTIRAAPGDVPAVVARMQAAWRGIAPAVPFRADTVDQLLYERFYQADAQRSRLFTIGAVLAILIGCIGLYGLAAFDTARRVKEIGIRKTLGASTGDVLRLLIGQFMRPVLLANLIAWPLAFVAMRRWLSGFDDRVALSPMFFLGASLAAVLIAAATIFGQAWRVARAEPARALRHE